MNRFFISLLGSMFLFASVFAEEAPLRSTKAVKMQKLDRSRWLVKIIKIENLVINFKSF